MRRRDGFSGQRSIVLHKMIIDLMSADPVLSTLHITDIGYYPHAYGHFRERTDPIGEYVLIYATDGEGWFEVNNRRHEIKSNTYFILPPACPHSYATNSDHPWTIYWIHFSGSLADEYSPETSVPHEIDPGNDSRIRDRINLFEEIYTTLDAGFSTENLRYAMSLFHHYIGSLRYLKEYRHAGSLKNDEDVIRETIHFMTENLERALTLDDLSDYSGLSRSYLSSSFKARTGHSPLSYFNLLKIKHACELLDATPMKINAICHKTGISDPYYFSRLFSKIMGMNPSAYRHRQKT